MWYEKIYVKDPDALLDFSIDWSGWLKSGENISTVTWTVPPGIVEAVSTHDDTSMTIWLSGGTAGEDYAITGSIITTASPARQDERTFLVTVRER